MENAEYQFLMIRNSTLDDSYDKYFIDNLRSERNDFSNILDIQNPAELVTSIINFEQFLDKGCIFLYY